MASGDPPICGYLPSNACGKCFCSPCMCHAMWPTAHLLDSDIDRIARRVVEMLRAEDVNPDDRDHRRPRIDNDNGIRADEGEG